MKNAKSCKSKLPIKDEFQGDNQSLRESIQALIALNDKEILIPHGIGGTARSLLSACYHRLSK